MTESTMRVAHARSSVSLRDFQAGFARALAATDPLASAAPRIADLARQPGFAIYRNTVMKGCIDALQANYPSVARLVGEEWFRAAAAIYVRAHLPRRPTLVDYGNGFASFLAAFDPAAELPYLPGVATLDRFWTEAHVAGDETPVPASDIARRSEQELALTVLRPHSAARWAWFSEQPIFTLWSRNRDPGDDDLSGVDWQPEGALITRPQSAVRSIALGIAGCAFLDACAADQPLGTAAAAALAADPEVDLAALLAQLLEAGAFGCVAGSTSPSEEK